MTNLQSEFINKVVPGAIAGWGKYKILPSVTIAQAIIESGWGESGLTVVSNNLFGIKGAYNGNYVNYETKEYINGLYRKVYANFKKYPNWTESILDHSVLLGTAKRYSNIVGCKDYKKVCQYLQQDGYATAPTYASTLIAIIEKFDLTKYDPLNKVKFYNFSSGPITNGDVKKFVELAKTLELKYYYVTDTED